MNSFVPSIFVFITLFFTNSVQVYCNQNSTVNSGIEALSLPYEPMHLSLILSKLRDKQAEKCDYGANPLVFDICKSIDLTNYENYMHKDLRLEEIVQTIIRPRFLFYLNIFINRKIIFHYDLDFIKKTFRISIIHSISNFIVKIDVFNHRRTVKK